MDLEGHDNWIRDIVLHPSGGYLISVADDKTLRIWSTEETQRCRVIVNAHDHFIYSVGRFSIILDDVFPYILRYSPISLGTFNLLVLPDFHKKLPYVTTSCTDSTIKVWECR